MGRFGTLAKMVRLITLVCCSSHTDDQIATALINAYSLLNDSSCDESSAPKHVPRGLQNNNNTCFVNSILQGMLACRSLHQMVSQLCESAAPTGVSVEADAPAPFFAHAGVQHLAPVLCSLLAVANTYRLEPPACDTQPKPVPSTSPCDCPSSAAAPAATSTRSAAQPTSPAKEELTQPLTAAQKKRRRRRRRRAMQKATAGDVKGTSSKPAVQPAEKAEVKSTTQSTSPAPTSTAAASATVRTLATPQAGLTYRVAPFFPSPLIESLPLFQRQARGRQEGELAQFAVLVHVRAGGSCVV